MTGSEEVELTAYCKFERLTDPPCEGIQDWDRSPAGPAGLQSPYR
jgi:hypothetical protein